MIAPSTTLVSRTAVTEAAGCECQRREHERVRGEHAQSRDHGRGADLETDGLRTPTAQHRRQVENRGGSHHQLAVRERLACATPALSMVV
jgi:hypothetical protein